ncbi:MAG: nicotinamide mononucleotide transporter [Burkholderiales bacterium]|nr:nicotinamide mononucleotide transporter [Burkholderiales bacterium]
MELAWLQALLLAARPLMASAFTLWGSPVTWLEIVAFVLSLAMVAANMRVNPLGWPLAMASSALYALLFADSKLYGEAALQLFFITVSLWGWWQWLRGRGDDGTALRVHRLTRAGLAWLGAGILCAWPLAALLLGRATDSDVPFLDALATVASVAGQLLLGRKLLENWLVWLGVNVFSVGLFAYKALWLTALLYALFALLSVAGWRAWMKRVAHPAQGAGPARRW